MAAVRVLIVDDEADARAALRVALEQHEDFEVVGEAGSGREALSLADTLFPDVIVMDVLMPTMSGTHAAFFLRESVPDVAIVLVTADEVTDGFREQAQAVGAHAIVAKARMDEVVEAVRAAGRD